MYVITTIECNMQQVRIYVNLKLCNEIDLAILSTYKK